MRGADPRRSPAPSARPSSSPGPGRPGPPGRRSSLAAALGDRLAGPAAVALLLAVGLSAAPAAQPMSIMATVGCVESGDDGRFHLVRATEPAALQERMPEEPPADAPLGTRTLRLVGTLDEFGVPARTGYKVWAKGLLNPGPSDGADLLNLTSITTLSERCEP